MRHQFLAPILVVVLLGCFAYYSVSVNLGQPEVIYNQASSHYSDSGELVENAHMIQISKRSWPNPFGNERVYILIRSEIPRRSQVSLREDINRYPFWINMVPNRGCQLVKTESTCLESSSDSLKCTNGEPPWDRDQKLSYFRNDMRQEFRVKNVAIESLLQIP